MYLVELRKKTTMYKTLCFLSIVLLSACGGGDDVPNTGNESTQLTWDQGSWDNNNWK